MGLATLAVAGQASAQSSVTIFGVVDAALSHGSGSVSSKWSQTTSGNSQSRLGFRGTEDLGGGLTAGFWLEAGLANDSGLGQATNTNNQSSGGGAANGITFNRRSFLSLAGGWGEVRLGRDYTPQFWNLALYDPFGLCGVGTSQMFVGTNGLSVAGTVPTGTRASNSIAYFLPVNSAGVFGQATYYMGENPSGTPTHDDGTGYGVRIGYASGPVNVALALSKTDYSTGDVKQNNVGASYDFGVDKVQVQASRESVGALKGRGYLLGGVVPFGPDLVRASVSSYRTDASGAPRSTKLALGYVHNFSKRTAIYVGIARMTNSAAANQALNGAQTALGRSSRGFDAGLTHSF
jgi:predicted porin